MPNYKWRQWTDRIIQTDTESGFDEHVLFK